jgi:hypothetical protein
MAIEPQLDVDTCLNKIEYLLIDYNIEEIIKKQNLKEESAQILRNFNPVIAAYELLTMVSKAGNFTEEQKNRYNSLVGIYKDKLKK